MADANTWLKQENKVDGGTGKQQSIDICRGEEGYPSRLEMLSDPPKVLHVKGTLFKGSLVAIVGSRKSDSRLQRFAHKLAGDLAGRGIGVISGGALGIDTAAHKGALDANGITVAVIGSGFDHTYPKSNESLFSTITQKGALVTEFESPVPPSKWTFPRRNRLVAAMASAVVVVQAPKRSGALITARIAQKLGVPVGAVPGPPGELGSQGCNNLIRTGSKMIEDADDVIRLIEGDSFMEQLNLPETKSRGIGTPAKPLTGLSQNEILVLDRLGFEPVHIDDIASGIDLTISQTAAALLNLELSGFVEDRGGKCFIRIE